MDWDALGLESRTGKLHTIGRGSYGDVFKCKSKDASTCAVKVFRTTCTVISKDALRELSLMKRLESRYTLQLLEISPPSFAHVAIVLPYEECDAWSLLKQPHFARGMPDDLVTCLACQLFAALAHLHHDMTPPILHRDASPNNLLLTRRPDNYYALKLSDFGSSCVVFPGATNTQRTMTTQMVSIWHRPPEILCGADKYGCAVDVWGAGSLVLQLMQGLNFRLWPRSHRNGQNEVQTQLYRIVRFLGPLPPRLSAALAQPLQRVPELLHDTPGIKAFMQQSHRSQFLRTVVELCLNLDATKRPTSRSVCTSPLFRHECARVHVELPPSLDDKKPSAKSAVGNNNNNYATAWKNPKRLTMLELCYCTYFDPQDAMDARCLHLAAHFLDVLLCAVPEDSDLLAEAALEDTALAVAIYAATHRRPWDSPPLCFVCAACNSLFDTDRECHDHIEKHVDAYSRRLDVRAEFQAYVFGKKYDVDTWMKLSMHIDRVYRAMDFPSDVPTLADVAHFPSVQDKKCRDATLFAPEMCKTRSLHQLMEVCRNKSFFDAIQQTHPECHGALLHLSTTTTTATTKQAP